MRETVIRDQVAAYDRIASSYDQIAARREPSLDGIDRLITRFIPANSAEGPAMSECAAASPRLAFSYRPLLLSVGLALGLRESYSTRGLGAVPFASCPAAAESTSPPNGRYQCLRC
jgi:hypothetical protein